MRGSIHLVLLAVLVWVILSDHGCHQQTAADYLHQLDNDGTMGAKP